MGSLLFTQDTKCAKCKNKMHEIIEWNEWVGWMNVVVWVPPVRPSPPRRSRSLPFLFLVLPVLVSERHCLLVLDTRSWAGDGVLARPSPWMAQTSLLSVQGVTRASVFPLTSLSLLAFSSSVSCSCPFLLASCAACDKRPTCTRSG